MHDLSPSILLFCLSVCMYVRVSVHALYASDLITQTCQSEFSLHLYSLMAQTFFIGQFINE